MTKATRMKIRIAISTSLLESKYLSEWYVVFHTIYHSFFQVKKNVEWTKKIFSGFDFLPSNKYLCAFQKLDLYNINYSKTKQLCLRKFFSQFACYAFL